MIREWIADIALQISTGDVHAFLLKRVNGNGATHATDNAPRERGVVAEKIRRALQQRGSFGNFKGSLIQLR